MSMKDFNTEFYRFLWSSILIALSACLGNVVDSIIVGNLIGGDGVSAINLSKPIIQFMFTISMLLSTGAGMLVGMELGKKDFDRASSIYTLMIVYKLYGFHKMALFISLALSLMVIPVLWIVSRFAPDQLWYSYLVAYIIETLLIVLFHRMGHLKFELKSPASK